MSYCRFENTYRDLLDCYYAMNNDKSESEQNYMRRLVDVCKDIIDEYELVNISEADDEWDDIVELERGKIEIEEAVEQSHQRIFK